MLAEDFLNGVGFRGVAQLRTRSVGIDVIDLLGGGVPVAERFVHRQSGPFAFGIRRRDVIRVATGAVPDQFRQDVRSGRRPRPQ